MVVFAGEAGVAGITGEADVVEIGFVAGAVGIFFFEASIDFCNNSRWIGVSPEEDLT